ncbi:MAG: SET domain-containing protein-lysine N-methyltransferase [Ginsengibacter sp.]
MPLLEASLVVKKSTIPGAGKGLFTKKMIPRGTRIVEYKGKISKWKDVDHKEGMNAYIYYVNRNHVIDASSNKNLARYANDAKGSKKITALTNNCIYVQDKKLRVFIESKKDIPAHSEILVGYGKEYWDIIMKNKMPKKGNKKSNKKSDK